MALLRLECFEQHGTIGDIDYWHYDYGWSHILSTTFFGNIDSVYKYGPYSSKSFKLYYNQYRSMLIKLPKTVYGDTCFVGFAVTQNAYSGRGFSIRQNATNANQLTFQFNRLDFSDNYGGNLVVRRGDYTGTVLATYPYMFTGNRYTYVTIEFRIHSTDGHVKVWLEGELAVDISGVNTQEDTDDGVDCVIFYSYLGLDHFYFFDGQGSKNNSYIAHPVIQHMWVGANGNYTEWTPNTGSNWQCVDDPGNTDADTTYVSTNTIDKIDTYGINVVAPGGENILGVVQGTVSRMVSGTGSIKSIVRLDGVDYPISGEMSISSSEYSGRSQVIEDNPAGGDWTLSDLENAEFGVKRVS